MSIVQKQEIKDGETCTNGYLAEATGNKCTCPDGKSCVKGKYHCQYTCPVDASGKVEDGKYCKDTDVTGENNQYAQKANCACKDGGACTGSGSNQKCAKVKACSSYSSKTDCDAADGCTYYQGACKDDTSTKEVKKTCADITPKTDENGEDFKARCKKGPNCKDVEDVNDDEKCSDQAGKCKCEEVYVPATDEDLKDGASTFSVFGILVAMYWMV